MGIVWWDRGCQHAQIISLTILQVSHHYFVSVSFYTIPVCLLIVNFWVMGVESDIPIIAPYIHDARYHAHPYFLSTTILSDKQAIDAKLVQAVSRNRLVPSFAPTLILASQWELKPHRRLVACHVHSRHTWAAWLDGDHKVRDRLKADTQNCILKKENQCISYFNQHYTSCFAGYISYFVKFCSTCRKLTEKTKVS